MKDVTIKKGSFMRYSVGRPATGMGGGAKPMERLCQPPSGWPWTS